MADRNINPDGIVKMAVPNYTHGKLSTALTNWLHISGQVGMDADGQTVDGFLAQARQAFSNLGAILDDAGMTWSDVQMLRIFMLNRDDIPDLRVARGEALGAIEVPSTLVLVSGLVHPDWQVELEVVAAKG